MADDFQYDVFLSHSSQDKAVVRGVAERLRGEGLRVWWDEWEIPFDVPLAHRMGEGSGVKAAKIEAGLENSRVLVLCMSAHAFGSDPGAPRLEAGTFRFRDPLNQQRRFIPLRLDDAPIKGSLTQFLSINWLPQDREREYANSGAPGLPATSEVAGGGSTACLRTGRRRCQRDQPSGSRCLVSSFCVPDPFASARKCVQLSQ